MCIINIMYDNYSTHNYILILLFCRLPARMGEECEIPGYQVEDNDVQ